MQTHFTTFEEEKVKNIEMLSHWVEIGNVHGWVRGKNYILNFQCDKYIVAMREYNEAADKCFSICVTGDSIDIE